MSMRLVNVKVFLAKNLGSPFIIAFEALILACAFLLIQGSPFVDATAVCAYCFLIIGVILQIASSIIERNHGSGV